jgi:peptidoglycan hydrolase CwlO-like protein
MDQAAGTNGTTALTVAQGDPEALRRQIETTRAELGDTVAALAVKADVKQQARNRIDQLKHQMTDKRSQLTDRARATSPESVTHATHSAAAQASAHPLPLIAGGAVLAGFLLGRLTAR